MITGGVQLFRLGELGGFGASGFLQYLSSFFCAEPRVERFDERREDAPARAESAAESGAPVVPFVDPELFQAVVDAHYRSLYLFALSLSRNEADAWDLTHDAFSAWRMRQHQIRDAEKVKSWLFTTLYRRFLDSARRRKRQIPHDPEIFATQVAEVSSGETADRQLDQGAVMRGLQSLPQRYRTVLTLYYLEDYAYREIAEILEIPLGTVMSRLARGRKLLARKLEDPPSKH